MAGSAATISFALSCSMRRSISPMSKPMVSMSKSSSTLEERLQLLGQEPVIPDGDFGQAIIGNHEGPLLHLGEMLKPDGRNLGPSEPPARQQPAMARDYIEISVHEDRDVKSEGLDAVGDLPDLLGAMLARVLRVRLQLVERRVGYRQRRPPQRPRFWFRGHGWRRTSTTPAGPNGNCESSVCGELLLSGGRRSRSETEPKIDPSQPRRNRIS